MRLRFLTLALLTAGALTPMTGTAPASAAPALSPAAYNQQVLASTNAERRAKGLRPLAASACANGYATRWARTLSGLGRLEHQPLGPVLRTCKARGVGENVAYGNVSPARMVRMWMTSPGHRRNILNPAYSHLGVGSVTQSSGRVYGVQVFLSVP